MMYTDQLQKVMTEREGYTEFNDCTVVALSVALEIPYSVAHRMLADQGRQERKRFRLVSWLENEARAGRTLCGYKPTVVKCGKIQSAYTSQFPWSGYTYPTLARVRRDFPKGRFIVRKKRHVFAMTDGEVHDNIGPRTRITNLVLFERA